MPTQRLVNPINVILDNPDSSTDMFVMCIFPYFWALTQPKIKEYSGSTLEVCPRGEKVRPRIQMFGFAFKMFSSPE